MFTTEVQLRVRYSETDQMGYVYYGNYASYFEVARVEALRTLGHSYRQMEDDGILLPVIDFSIRYHNPGKYDDLLIIKTSIPRLPAVRISFEYKTYNESGLLLNEAETTLVFVNKSVNRPVKAPAALLESLGKYF